MLEITDLKNLPKELRISTMTATSKFNSPIDLKSLYDALQINDTIIYLEYGNNPIKGVPRKRISKKKQIKKKVFFNQLTVLVRIEDTFNNIKLFNNGSISMTGVKSEKKAKMAINYLFQFIIDSKLFQVSKPEIEFFNIVLINSDYDIGFELKRSILHQILVNKYKIFSSFEPCIYPGVNSKFFYNKDYVGEKHEGKCYCNEYKCMAKKGEKERCTCKKIPGTDFCKEHSRREDESEFEWRQRVPICSLSTKSCTGKGKGQGIDNCKKITISAFQSGSIIITGANSIDQIISAFNFISCVFSKHYEEIKKNIPPFISSKVIFSEKIKKRKNIIWLKKDNIVPTSLK